MIKGEIAFWAFLKFSILRSEFSILEIISQLTGRWQPRPPLQPFCLPPIRRLDCSLDKLSTTNAHVLKVPSGQIGSASEWYYWIGIKGHQPLYVFLFFYILILNIWEEFKVLSRFIQKWIKPPACWDHGLFGILSHCRTIICWKSATLFWFGLRDCWFSSNILPTIQEQLLTLQHFESKVRRKRS